MNSAEPPWDHYRTFAAALEHGSLSGAARALGLTQPTVSRHIDQLETALGRRLFLRSPGGLAPTDAALALQPYVATLGATAAALLRGVADAPAPVAGSVRISASEVVAVERLPPILAALRRDHPDLALELVASNAIDDLLRRDADIAVRMTTPTQGALLARRVRPAAVGLFARADYLARRGLPADLAGLTAFDLIGFDRETPALRAMAQAVPGFRRAAFALRTDSQLAHLAAIRAGFGIGVCQVAIAARAPALVRVLPDAFAHALETWVVMHEDLRATPRCRAVFDALVRGLDAEP